MNSIDRNFFMNNIVFGYIKDDLQNMITKIPVNIRRSGNINFPIAVCTLMYMEYLGSFLLGKDKDFEGNVKEYITKCFDKPDDYCFNEPNNCNVKILREIFRNGLSHVYFARGGISRDNKRPPLYVDVTGEVILDAQTLANDFLNSLEKFKNELDESKFNKRMHKLIKEIKNKKKDCKEEIDKLPSSSTNITNIGDEIIENTTTRPHGEAYGDKNS